MHELQKKYKSEIEEFVSATKKLGESGFVTSQGGNLSYRVSEDVVLITPTKVPKVKITFDDVCIINMKGDILFAIEGRKPTGETPMHLNILNKRPDAKGVIHAHPPYITGFAIARSNLLSRPLLPEPIIEVGPVLSADYAEPITDELAEAFDPVILKTNAWLMENHGITMCNHEGVGRAFELLEMIEALAQSAMVALTCGNVVEIPREEVKKLEKTIKTRGLPMPGLPGHNSGLEELYFD